ncbi:NAD(P)H-binding protein, partial [Burkholderia cenocepacia]|uniref:NAD(P)H-binding protein n=4 Tax=Pseudomonadota TaxID=1224 RepID=UPI00222DEC75
INHTLLAINYGAILVLLVPVLIGWTTQPTGIAPAYAGLLSIFATTAAFGAALFGARDFAASRRLGRMATVPAATLVEKLPPRQTVLITGATGFIGSRLVASLAASGHQVIALIRNPAKAETLSPPVTLITSL